jgi:hypothetical protein
MMHYVEGKQEQVEILTLSKSYWMLNKMEALTWRQLVQVLIPESTHRKFTDLKCV